MIWVKNVQSGKANPLDAVPVPDGNVWIDEAGLAHYIKAGEEVPNGLPRYKSHFATCPNAREHRKPKE